MENAFIDSLNNLFNSYSLLVENEKKNDVLLIVDESIANNELEKVVQFFSDKINIRYVNPLKISSSKCLYL